MTTTAHRYQSDFARRYYDQGQAEGEAKGKADSVLQVLEGRGIEVPDAARARISDCTDIAQLDSWLSRALVAVTVDELFA